MDKKCSCCGNTYDRAFSVTSADGEQFVFDCIECAAQVLAPHCIHCGCIVLGKGVAAVGDGSVVYCCAHCQRADAGDAAALGGSVDDDGRRAEDFDDTADDFIG